MIVIYVIIHKHLPISCKVDVKVAYFFPLNFSIGICIGQFYLLWCRCFLYVLNCFKATTKWSQIALQVWNKSTDLLRHECHLFERYICQCATTVLKVEQVYINAHKQIHTLHCFEEQMSSIFKSEMNSILYFFCGLCSQYINVDMFALYNLI